MDRLRLPLVTLAVLVAASAMAVFVADPLPSAPVALTGSAIHAYDGEVNNALTRLVVEPESTEAPSPGESRSSENARSASTPIALVVAAEGGAAAADATTSGRAFEDILNSDNRTFTRYLQSLQSRAAQTGVSPLTSDQAQQLWDSAMERGFTAPRGVEEEWVGGAHINLYGPGGGPNIHFPVPPAWAP